MRYVLDANVAFKWEVPEPGTVKALRLRNDYRAGVHDLCQTVRGGVKMVASDRERTVRWDARSVVTRTAHRRRVVVGFRSTIDLPVNGGLAGRSEISNHFRQKTLPAASLDGAVFL